MITLYKINVTQFSIFFKGFSWGVQVSLQGPLTNSCLRWKLAAGHRVLQLLRLELGSKPNRTLKPYSGIDNPLGYIWWLHNLQLSMLIKK